jgi:hypothetical protein
VDRFFKHTSFFGQVADIDNQGRVLIHSRLREQTGMAGEVDVVGSFDHLEVWNLERLKADLAAAPFTDADRRVVASLLRQANAAMIRIGCASGCSAPPTRRTSPSMHSAARTSTAPPTATSPR